ncbi:MAG: response regulator [Candidatus Cloacimonetes bacterium]|nr:response regulator [Candidatus Cloacimonadota bacterium]
MKNKVLIIDDEEVICEVAQEMLELIDVEAFIAMNKKEAMSCFQENQHEIALAILDYNLPDTNGVDILNELFKINKDFIPILATGMYVKSDIPKYQAMGFQEVIDKPYGLNVLKDIKSKYLKE